MYQITIAFSTTEKLPLWYSDPSWVLDVIDYAIAHGYGVCASHVTFCGYRSKEEEKLADRFFEANVRWKKSNRTVLHPIN